MGKERAQGWFAGFIFVLATVAAWLVIVAIIVVVFAK
jgi:hypothetical protein